MRSIVLAAVAAVVLATGAGPALAQSPETCAQYRDAVEICRATLIGSRVPILKVYAEYARGTGVDMAFVRLPRPKEQNWYLEKIVERISTKDRAELRRRTEPLFDEAKRARRVA